MNIRTVYKNSVVFIGEETRNTGGEITLDNPLLVIREKNKIGLVEPPGLEVRVTIKYDVIGAPEDRLVEEYYRLRDKIKAMRQGIVVPEPTVKFNMEGKIN